MKDIILRRENLGFVLGAISVFAAYELSEIGAAFVVIVLVFIGFPLARKYGV